MLLSDNPGGESQQLVVTEKGVIRVLPLSLVPGAGELGPTGKNRKSLGDLGLSFPLQISSVTQETEVAPL